MPNDVTARASLAEIATAADVSEATVSRVINRRSGVAATTREAVERAMREIGVARPVAGQLVALITPNLSNPFFAHLGERIESELAPYGLRTVVCPVSSGTVHERDYVSVLVETGVAAIVFMSSGNTLRAFDRSPADLLSSRGVPFVTINGGFDGAPSPTFSTNEHVAARLAVMHLTTLGHRRIGLAAGPSGNIPSDRRTEGFVQIMTHLGVDDAAALVVRQSYSIEGGRHATEDLLRRGCTAIVAASDQMALGAYQAVERAGLRIPADVSVVGYDDDELLDFISPPLTTIRTPIARLAQETAQSVLTMVSGNEVEQREMLFDPELHLRSSTGPPPQ
ncbi:MAG: LacI family DNA-binding transcriptional regulator [Microbacterium sp.]